MMLPDAGHQEPTRMSKSIPRESASELLRRHKDAMQSSTMATRRNDHRRNVDRGNGDDDSATLSTNVCSWPKADMS